MAARSVTVTEVLIGVTSDKVHETAGVAVGRILSLCKIGAAGGQIKACTPALNGQPT
ncbi:protein of unknown function [Hyphomicrobium sp. 1Nfss2.1]